MTVDCSDRLYRRRNMTINEASRFESVLGKFAAAPIALLQAIGAHRVQHSGGTLLDHLVGTAAILRRWGYDEDVCLAGLFHSVYGTSTFEKRLLSLDERARLVQVIGASAEQTAFLFSQILPESLWEALGSDQLRLRCKQSDSRLSVDALELNRLLVLFWANEVEQAHRAVPKDGALTFHALISASAHVLTERALREIYSIWTGSRVVVPIDMFAERVLLLENFYDDIERVFDFSLKCPKRAYTLGYIKGMESVIGYPSRSVLEKIKEVLGVREIVDKTDEQSLFGIFRYLMVGDSPSQIGVHVDRQPWTLIVYISPTVDQPATGIFRHLRTGVCDLGKLERTDREEFVNGPLKEDRYNANAWQCVYSTAFKQNTAMLFKSQDFPHSNMITWGIDTQSARITQNFNFQVR
jgi:hypothetical protein